MVITVDGIKELAIVKVEFYTFLKCGKVFLLTISNRKTARTLTNKMKIESKENTLNSRVREIFMLGL